MWSVRAHERPDDWRQRSQHDHDANHDADHDPNDDVDHDFNDDVDHALNDDADHDPVDDAVILDLERAKHNHEHVEHHDLVEHDHDLVEHDHELVEHDHEFVEHDHHDGTGDADRVVHLQSDSVSPEHLRPQLHLCRRRIGSGIRDDRRHRVLGIVTIVVAVTALTPNELHAQSSLQVPLQFDFLNPGARSLALGSALDDATAAFTKRS